MKNLDSVVAKLGKLDSEKSYPNISSLHIAYLFHFMSWNKTLKLSHE